MPPLTRSRQTAASLPVGGDTVAAQLNAAADQATKAQQSMQQAATALGDAATHIANGTADADTARRDLKSQIAAAKQSITQLQTRTRAR